MKRIKIAQIGTSRYSHGKDIFSTLVNNPEVFEVVGYAMPENEKEKFPEGMQVFQNHKELTVAEIMDNPEIEAVAIETEEIYLTKYALMAAKHKKHIHMEKPGGAVLADFEELIDIAKSNNLILHIGYMYRYNPCIQDIINRVKHGEIGDIISVEAQMSCWQDEEYAKFLSTFPGGMMFFLGCHLVDLILLIQGNPKKILPFNKNSGTYHFDTKDFSFALFEYENGISFLKTTKTEYAGFSRRQLVITGSKGTFEIRPLEINAGYPNLYTEYLECKSTDWDDKGKLVRSDNFNRYQDMMCSFAKIIVGEAENPYTCDYELTLYKTLLKCCE